MDVPAITLPAMFSFFGWLIFTSIRRYKIANVQAQVQTKLLEKLGSGQELIAYAQSDTGKQLLESLQVERMMPHSKIIGALQVGIICFVVGGAFLLLRGAIPNSSQGFLVIGTLICAVGLGFALSAAASYFLSKSFGLLNGATRAR